MLTRRKFLGTTFGAGVALATGACANRVPWRQRITHFTEELPFLSESDKDWVMGRAIRERLKWT